MLNLQLAKKYAVAMFELAQEEIKRLKEEIKNLNESNSQSKQTKNSVPVYDFDEDDEDMLQRGNDS